MFRPRNRWAAAGVAATLIVATLGLATPAQAAPRTASAKAAAAVNVTVSGQVRDGSGHGWPLYARVSVDGVPTTFTDPLTGRYDLSLADGNGYTLTVTPLYPGYQPAQAKVELNGADVTRDIAVSADLTTCAAPGYAEKLKGLTEAFESPNTPAGWSVVNNTPDGGWVFTDDGERGNLTGGTGGFAIADSDHLGQAKTQDTELRTPVLDFTGMTAPNVRFNSDYRAIANQFGDLDLSLDSGQTWTTLVHNVSNARGPSLVDIPLPQAAGLSTVELRWRLVGTWGWWWEIDNVFAGQRTCEPVHGGLVVGQTIDANTHAGLNGVTVRVADARADTTTSAATPDDPALDDGFYWLFSSQTGNHPFEASRGGYLTATKTVNVATDWATKADFTLGAAKITVSQSAIAKTVKMGNTATATLTVKNTGAAPATVSVGERDNGVTTLLHQGTGAALNEVKGSYSRHREPTAAQRADMAKEKANAVKATTQQPYAAPWTDIANFPTPIMDNTVATGGGKVYSVGGTDGSDSLATGAVFDPSTGSWSSIAPMSQPRQRGVAEFVRGRMYVVGGWGSDGNPLSTVEIYDPVSNTWSAGATAPGGLAASGGALLGDRIYVVGGCDFGTCGFHDVRVYDTAANTWSTAADYPLATSWLACGGVLGQVYCAGGTDDNVDTTQAYSYDPAINTWTRIADLPIDLWAMGYVGTADAFLVSGGVTDNASTLTNQGFAFSPVSGAWIPIANSNNTVYRSGSACGFYKVGGSVGQFNAIDQAEVLPGFDQCGAATDVPWLSVTPTSFTVAPGANVKLTVTLDAGPTVITQPGTYAADITFVTNTPYDVPPTSVTMTATPPNTWGKITGTVTGAGCGGTVPLAGAVVQIDTWAAHYTLITDANGNYGYWLDKRNNPLTLIVAKDGWQPQTRTAKITAGQATTVDWNLAPIRAC